MRKTAKEIYDGNEKQFEEWIASATSEELHGLLGLLNPSSSRAIRVRDIINIESAKTARKPHWTTWLSILISILALIIAILVWLRPVVLTPISVAPDSKSATELKEVPRPNKSSKQP
jgi:hypothetical protein